MTGVHPTDPARARGYYPEDPERVLAEIRTTIPLEERTLPLQLPGSGAEGVDARVSEIGRGLPVVFLHGLVGLNDHWEDVVQRVHHRCRCIMLEIPLLDLSGDNCSIGGVTALTERFLAEYLDQPAVLVGNSFGGHVALRLALEHAAHVRGLVLAGSSGLIEKSMVRDVQIRPSREWLVEKIGELFYDRAFMREADVDRAYRELSERSKARAMVRLSRTARRDHLGDRISAIGAPTLLIWGRNDVVTPPEAALEFKRLLPRSRITWFDRCGHVPMVECADEFAVELVRFVEELERAPGSRAP